MKRYRRHRTGEEVIALARANGISFNADRFDEGSDHILLYMDGPGIINCPVLYSVVSGRFFCADEGFPQFNSDQQHDGEPWFDALLDFFCTNDPETT